MSGLLDYFATRQDQMVQMLTEFVNIESPTSVKAAVDKMSQHLAHICEERGAQVQIHPREEVGDILLATWNADAQGAPLVIISHMDTVLPLGTLQKRPVRLDGEGRLYGPGALDMKGGIVVALEAIAALQARDEMPDCPIVYLITTDEEKGSVHSRELIEQTANGARLVLITEPPTGDGELKTWRKGTASYKINITGRASHAGNEPEAGINAIIEFAQHALELNKLNDLPNGTSVSVTMVEGGSAGNVIPAQVTAHIDVRTMTLAAYNKVHAEIMDRMPFIPGAQIDVEQHSARPPMERDEPLFQKAKSIAAAEQITIRAGGSGGGSDGNFTAAMGIPTLDGLGAMGQGLHADHEHVIISSLPQKAALMAALLRDWK